MNADLMICDGQYTEKEYISENSPKQGWGHGTIESCVREFTPCKPKKMLIVHHDPTHSDEFLSNIDSVLDYDIILAKQGMEVEI